MSAASPTARRPRTRWRAPGPSSTPGAYLVETLQDIYAQADDITPIDTPERTRMSLACSHAIATSESVADWCYKAAGATAIFLGSAFERRWRDLHNVSQQIQSRAQHFETVGEILLDIEQPGIFY